MAKASKGYDNEDRMMMLHAGEWPCWPVLPLKRGNHSLEDKNLGILLADQAHDDAAHGRPDSKFIVYHVYMYDLPRGKAGWDAAPKTEYKTVEEIQADGWIVD